QTYSDTSSSYQTHQRRHLQCSRCITGDSREHLECLRIRIVPRGGPSIHQLHLSLPVCAILKQGTKEGTQTCTLLIFMLTMNQPSARLRRCWWRALLPT